MATGGFVRTTVAMTTDAASASLPTSASSREETGPLDRLDPRLQPIVAAERGRLLRTLVQGVAATGCGLFLAAVPIGTGSAGGGELFAAAMGLGLLWFGVRSLRAWRRGPMASRTVRWLTRDRAELAGWSVDEVVGQRRLSLGMLRVGLEVALGRTSLQGGVLLFLYGKDRSFVSVTVATRARDEVLAGLTALAPRRTNGVG